MLHQISYTFANLRFSTFRLVLPKSTVWFFSPGICKSFLPSAHQRTLDTITYYPPISKHLWMQQQLTGSPVNHFAQIWFQPQKDSTCQNVPAKKCCLSKTASKYFPFLEISLASRIFLDEATWLAQKSILLMSFLGKKKCIYIGSTFMNWPPHVGLTSKNIYHVCFLHLKQANVILKATTGTSPKSWPYWCVKPSKIDGLMFHWQTYGSFLDVQRTTKGKTHTPSLKRKVVSPP